MCAKFVKLNKQLLAVICSFKSLLIYNDSLTEKLFKFDIPSDSEWFTCASLAYCADSSEERIAVGTSRGNIYTVSVSGGAFEQVIGFQNKGAENAITCMSSDPVSKTLCAVTGNGATLMLKIRKTKDWECVVDLGFDWPALTVDVLLRTQNLFVIGYASGMVKLVKCDTGRTVCELQAHSR